MGNYIEIFLLITIFTYVAEASGVCWLIIYLMESVSLFLCVYCAEMVFIRSGCEITGVNEGKLKCYMIYWTKTLKLGVLVALSYKDETFLTRANI